MLTIHLSNLRFVAYHGLYEGEGLIGNDFEVNVDAGFNEENMDLTNLDDLINYEAVYRIVQARMKVPTALLETVALLILEDIRTKYAFIKMIRISIQKLNAPISHFRGSVGITLERSF